MTKRAKHNRAQPADDDVRRRAFEVGCDLLAGVIDRSTRGDLDTLLAIDAHGQDGLAVLHLIALAARVATAETLAQHADELRPPESGP